MSMSIRPNGPYPEHMPPTPPNYATVWRAVLLAVLFVSMLAMVFGEAI